MTRRLPAKSHLARQLHAAQREIGRLKAEADHLRAERAGLAFAHSTTTDALIEQNKAALRAWLALRRARWSPWAVQKAIRALEAVP